MLIHSATGGVGLAAVSIAKMIGARIYATAGSDAKRELLSGLGVEYVGDSRSGDFADEILDVTAGYGVDVILNSLPGEAIRRGVQILAPGGRFIELGKKDVYADATLGLAALAKSATFAVVDLDLNLRLQPERYRRLLQQILEHVADGELQVLPVTEFTLDTAIDAFRLMASGQHTGKIVISIPVDGSIEAVAPAPPQPPVTRDGGYIVVGGMGGLGFVIAQWLVTQGAGMVVLNGRSAPGADVSGGDRGHERQGRPGRGGHRRYRGARHRRAPGRCRRGRRTAAGRCPAQRDGSGRRDRAEHVGVRGGAGVRPEGRGQLAAP